MVWPQVTNGEGQVAAFKRTRRALVASVCLMTNSFDTAFQQANTVLSNCIQVESPA